MYFLMSASFIEMAVFSHERLNLAQYQEKEYFSKD